MTVNTVEAGTTPALPETAPPQQPSWIGRWLFAGLLFFAYLPMQLVLAIPVMGVIFMVEGPDLDLDALMQSELLIWLTLAAAAVAGALAILLALVWPVCWKLLTRRRTDLADWLAWRRPERLPLWVVPLITLPLLVAVGLGVSMLFGETEIEIQMLLFSTPVLSVASAVVVSTVVPAAEEFIFRGALYNALLRSARPGEPRWKRHAIPFAAVTLLFAGVHLLAGFETIAALIQILLLSAFLTALRSWSGSVKASLVAHLVWNLTAAVLMTLVNFIPGLST
jgi:membrane protease YdiL (CAAX protease family)